MRSRGFWEDNLSSKNRKENLSFFSQRAKACWESHALSSRRAHLIMSSMAWLCLNRERRCQHMKRRHLRQNQPVRSTLLFRVCTEVTLKSHSPDDSSRGYTYTEHWIVAFSITDLHVQKTCSVAMLRKHLPALQELRMDEEVATYTSVSDSAAPSILPPRPRCGNPLASTLLFEESSVSTLQSVSTEMKYYFLY